jgi:ribosomal protein S20
LIKLFFQNLEVAKIDKTSQSQKNLQIILSSISSFLDKGTKKNVFHKNTAAKKKAKLAYYLRISR